MVVKTSFKYLRHLAKSVVYKTFPDFRISTFHDVEFLTYVYKKKLGLLRCADKIETIALGSSYADYNFLDLNNGETYNIGLTSLDMYGTYQLYKKSTNIITNLQNIIVFFAPFSPGFELSKSREKYRKVAYAHFFGIPYQDARDINTNIERVIIRKCIALAEPDLIYPYSGYDKKEYLGLNVDVVKRAKTHLRENTRLPDQMCWLNKMIKLADQFGHKIWIVIPPVRSDYKSQLPKSEILFSKLYNINIGQHTILDFYDDHRFCDIHMGDSDHMNESGAMKLTEEIMNLIQGVN